MPWLWKRVSLQDWSLLAWCIMTGLPTFFITFSKISVFFQFCHQFCWIFWPWATLNGYDWHETWRKVFSEYRVGNPASDNEKSYFFLFLAQFFDQCYWNLECMHVLDMRIDCWTSFVTVVLWQGCQLFLKISIFFHKIHFLQILPLTLLNSLALGPTEWIWLSWNMKKGILRMNIWHPCFWK